MKMLITAASTLELTAVKQCSISNMEMDFLLTGVGSYQTLYSLMEKDISPYAVIVQAGIAGAIDRSLHLGDVKLISEDSWGDLGVWDNKTQFKSVFDLGLDEPNRFPFTKGKLVNPFSNSFMQKVADTLPKATSVTVNQISTCKRMITHFANQELQLESLEGAAFHFFCLQKNVTFLQMRVVSNYVGERNKSKWKIDKALQNLVQTLDKVLRDVT